MVSNTNYWVTREQDHALKQIKDEKIIMREIEKRYKQAYDAIQAEINQFYVNYAGKEMITIEQAKKRASKLDIAKYAKKAEKYVKTHDFSKIANDEMRLYNLTMRANRLELLKSNIGLELVDVFNGLDTYYDDKLTLQARNEFKRQAGILGETVFNNQKAIRQIVTASFHNATFSDRIWMYQGSLKSEIDKLLVRGLTQGKNPVELARELRNRFSVSQYDARRLMVTEMARVQSEVQKAAYEEYGYNDYEFIAEPTACPICSALNGKKFKVEDMQAGVNASPMHGHCKCSTTADSGREAMEKEFSRRGL